MTHLDSAPVLRPLRLDANHIDGSLNRDAGQRLSTVTSLLHSNGVRLRAAVLLFERTTSLLAPVELASADPVAYTDLVQSNLQLEGHWRRAAARDAVFAAHNLYFLFKLLSQRPLDFGMKPGGRSHDILTQIYNELAAAFPDLWRVRNAAAHSDQIFREPEKNEIDGTIESLHARSTAGGKLLISDGLNDDRYIATIGGDFVDFPVNRDTYQTFVTAYLSAARAFDPNPTIPDFLSGDS